MKDDALPNRETYMHGHHPVVVDEHARRSAEHNAAYLLPYLKPGMSILDIGCGPGSITTGLAKAVLPGQTIGIDMSKPALERAEADAHVSGISNVEYRIGDAYSLPFADESFNCTHMHQVLQHMAEPEKAVLEAMRVLRADGLFGVTEVDWGTAVFWPQTSETDRFLEIYDEVALYNGGDPNFGRRLRSMFEPIPLQRFEIGATVWTFGDAASTEQWGDLWQSRIQESHIATVAMETGISTHSELCDVGQGLHDWGQSPVAYFSMTHTEALAWK